MLAAHKSSQVTLIFRLPKMRARQSRCQLSRICSALKPVGVGWGSLDRAVDKGDTAVVEDNVDWGGTGVAGLSSNHADPEADSDNRRRGRIGEEVVANQHPDFENPPEN